jgi:hypothetical protein
MHTELLKKSLMILKILRAALILISIAITVDASGQESNAKQKDTSTLAHALIKGKLDLHFRFYYMSTNNESPLSDYYAYAVGGGMKYETGSFKGFQFGLGGFFIWNIGSSNLTIPDPTTGIYNRYEVGQFDMEDFSNKNNMDRLEDFYLKYNVKKSTIVLGKQGINTPFINPQDGRMRPTGEQGIWSDIRTIPKTRIQAGWLTKISPRGTVRWFDMDSSIGIYPSGVSINGIKSNYKGNLSSAGVGILGVGYEIIPKWNVQAWEYYTDNIFNTLMLQTDGEWKIGGPYNAIAGLLYIHQNALGGGGNEDPSKTYFAPGQDANIFSGRLGLSQKSTKLLFNYTRITGDGRFLFPREWGREPLYTFLRRERSEGAGDVNAFSVNLLNEFSKRRIKTELSYGYYELPEIKNYRLNKYGLPSYHQFLFDINYSFGGFMKGLEAEFFYTYKLEAENVLNRKNIINKVNMSHINIIINYRL